MAKNPLGIRRDIEDPYATFMAGGCEIRVLKTYKLAKNEIADPYARWHTVGKSPMTFGSWEYGDTYRREVTDNFQLTYASDEFIEAYRNDPAIMIAIHVGTGIS